MDKSALMWGFMPPDRLAQIIRLAEGGQITQSLAKRLFHLVYGIREGWVFENKLKDEDELLWYVAGQLAWGFNFEGHSQELSGSLPDVPEELVRITDKKAIEAFCQTLISSEPKFHALYRQGKKGPLIGRILRASCDRIAPEDIPQDL